MHRPIRKTRVSPDKSLVRFRRLVHEYYDDPRLRMDIIYAVGDQYDDVLNSYGQEEADIYLLDEENAIAAALEEKKERKKAAEVEEKRKQFKLILTSLAVASIAAAGQVISNYF